MLCGGDGGSTYPCGAHTYLREGRLLSYHSELMHTRAPCLSFHSQLLQGCLASEDSRCSCAFAGAGRKEPVDIVCCVLLEQDSHCVKFSISLVCFLLGSLG